MATQCLVISILKHGFDMIPCVRLAETLLWAQMNSDLFVFKGLQSRGNIWNTLWIHICANHLHQGPQQEK